MTARIAFVTIATNKYMGFVPKLIKSIRKYVQVSDAEIDCFVLTNEVLHTPEVENLGIKTLFVPHLSWPLITLLRYEFFLQYKEVFKDYQFMFYIDADMEVVAPIGGELVEKPIVATIHPGQYNWPLTQCTFDKHPGSLAHINTVDSRTKYVIGAFQGGATPLYLTIVETLANHIKQDLSKNIIADWHDESHWNAYLQRYVQASPDYNLKDIKYLDPGYCYPEGWNLPFTPKIKALDKDQEQIRS